MGEYLTFDNLCIVGFLIFMAVMSYKSTIEEINDNKKKIIPRPIIPKEPSDNEEVRTRVRYINELIERAQSQNDRTINYLLSVTNRQYLQEIIDLYIQTGYAVKFEYTIHFVMLVISW